MIIQTTELASVSVALVLANVKLAPAGAVVTLTVPMFVIAPTREKNTRAPEAAQDVVTVTLVLPLGVATPMHAVAPVASCKLIVPPDVLMMSERDRYASRHRRVELPRSYVADALGTILCPYADPNSEQSFAACAGVNGATRRAGHELCAHAE